MPEKRDLLSHVDVLCAAVDERWRELFGDLVARLPRCGSGHLTTHQVRRLDGSVAYACAFVACPHARTAVYEHAPWHAHVLAARSAGLTDDYPKPRKRPTG